MIKFDHLRIPVTDLARSRDWYIRTLGLKVEFEVADRQMVALQDTNELAADYGLGRTRINAARKIIEEHRDEIRAAWARHFGS
jgi:catechol 2,3-dioxygenase-like lactoylglutathione lyase family enzyme